MVRAHVFFAVARKRVYHTHCQLIICLTEHIRNLKQIQDQNTASMDEMEKDYLEQLQAIEDENEKLKSSISEGNDLLSQCQRALTLASQKSATLAVIFRVCCMYFIFHC